MLLLELVTYTGPVYYEATVAAVAITAGATALIAGAVDYGISKNKEKKAAEKAAQKEAELKAFQDNRQEIIDNSDDIRALAAQVNNPFANLSVATGAAEFEAEQADLALAQSLDTMAATGASAGGATALARAALASKKGISNSIQQQEAQNQKLAAQGAQQAQQQRLNLQLQAETEEAAAFDRQERRDMVDMGIIREDQQFQQNLELQYGLAAQDAVVGTIENVGGAVGKAATAGLL